VCFRRDAILVEPDLILQTVVDTSEIGSDLIRTLLLTARIQVAADIQMALVLDQTLHQVNVLLAALPAGCVVCLTIPVSSISLNALPCCSLAAITVACACGIHDLDGISAFALVATDETSLARSAAVASSVLVHREELNASPILTDGAILTGQIVTALLEPQSTFLTHASRVAERLRSALASNKLLCDIAGTFHERIAFASEGDGHAGVVFFCTCHASTAVSVFRTGITVRADREAASVVADGDAEATDRGCLLAFCVLGARRVLRGKGTVSVETIIGELADKRVV